MLMISDFFTIIINQGFISNRLNEGVKQISATIQINRREFYFNCINADKLNLFIKDWTDLCSEEYEPTFHYSCQIISLVIFKVHGCLFFSVTTVDDTPYQCNTCETCFPPAQIPKHAVVG